MKKTRIRIVAKLYGSATQKQFDINEEYMLGMAGKIFEVSESPATIRNYSSLSIYCTSADRTFKFSTKDITIIPDEPTQPLPDPEQFDPKNLFI